MTFHAGYDEVILFKFWTTSSVWSLLLAAVVIGGVTFLTEVSSYINLRLPRRNQKKFVCTPLGSNNLRAGRRSSGSLDIYQGASYGTENLSSNSPGYEKPTNSSPNESETFTHYPSSSRVNIIYTSSQCHRKTDHFPENASQPPETLDNSINIGINMERDDDLLGDGPRSSHNHNPPSENLFTLSEHFSRESGGHNLPSGNFPSKSRNHLPSRSSNPHDTSASLSYFSGRLSSPKASLSTSYYQPGSTNCPTDRSKCSVLCFKTLPRYGATHILSTLIYGYQTTFNLLIMLSFMTCNVWICFAIILGRLLGYAVIKLLNC